MKRTFWTCFAFTIVGILNIVLFAILTSYDIVGVRRMAYLYPVCFLVLAWLPLLLQWIFKMHFNLAFLIVFEIYVFLGICVGSQWRMYTAGFSFDKYVHTLGGVMLALLAYEVFIKCKGNKLNLFWLFVLLFSFSMMCGGVWEIYEFATDDWMGNNAQHAREFVGRDAVVDTMLDIICDFSGGVAGAGIAVLIEAEKAKKQKEKAQGAQAGAEPKNKNVEKIEQSETPAKTPAKATTKPATKQAKTQGAKTNKSSKTK